MKNVMPYTDLSAPAGEGLSHEEPSILEDKLGELSSWLDQNGFSKEANQVDSVFEIAEQPLFSHEHMIGEDAATLKEKITR